MLGRCMRKRAERDEREYVSQGHGRSAVQLVPLEGEPQGVPLASKRSDLVVQITELEGCLYYMGTGHPQREATRRRLDSLKALLTRWDRALKLQNTPSR